MAEAVRKNKILCAVAALSLVSALFLCGVRFSAEIRNTEVCAVMTAGDVSLLSSGAPEGVTVFDGGATLDGSLLLIEDENQYSFRPFGETDEKTYTNPDGTLRRVRCFKLDGEYASRVGVLGYDGCEEITNILYRAVTDRNIRVIWLTPFRDAVSGEMLTDTGAYSEVLRSLSARLQRHGLTLGNSFSLLPDYETAAVPAAAVFAGVIAAWWVLFRLLTGRNKTAAALCTAAVAAGSLLLHPLGLAPTVYSGPALAAAVVFPCLAFAHAARRLEKTRGDGPGRELASYLGILFSAALIALAGGLCVAALESSTNYLLAVENFRGVKISLLLPLAFAVYAVFRFLCPPRDILKGGVSRLIPAAVLLLLVLGYYLLRAGNAQVGVFEQRFRNFLEAVLIARPRTKEAFIAWPCLACAFLLCARNKKIHSWFFAILPAAGFSSVVNTFCHARSPLWLSLTRTLTGLIIGAGIGCALICFFRPPEKHGAKRREEA